MKRSTYVSALAVIALLLFLGGYWLFQRGAQEASLDMSTQEVAQVDIENGIEDGMSSDKDMGENFDDQEDREEIEYAQDTEGTGDQDEQNDSVDAGGTIICASTPCMIAAISEHEEARYEGLSEYAVQPGVLVHSDHTWMYIPAVRDLFRFSVRIDIQDVVTEPGWFESLTRSASDTYSRSLVVELDHAEFPTEAELNAMDPTLRLAVEREIEGGASASDVAWQSAEWSATNQMKSMLLGGPDTVYICESSDRTGLQALIEQSDPSALLTAEDFDSFGCRRE